MSRGELWKGVAVNTIMIVVFGAIGYFAILYALQMVGIFGEGMGVDDRSREIYAQSHKIVHLFAAACGLAIGWFLHRRNWVLFSIALTAIILCGGYGVLNMYGFTSTNRVTVAATKDAARDSAERAYQSARADLMGQIKWLQQTAVGEDGRERRKLLAEVDAKRKELSALKPPVPTTETVLSDPQSSSLADLTGTSAKRWMITLPLPLAIFMFFAESFSLVIVGHMLAGIVGLFAGYFAAARTSVPSSPKGSSGEGGGEVKPTEDSKDKPANDGANVVPIRAQSDQFHEPPKVSAAPPRVPAPAPRPSLPLTLKPTTYASVEEFLETHPHVTNQKVIVKETGFSPAKVSRDIKRLKGRGKVKVEKTWRSNAVTFTPRRNGERLHVVI